MKGISWKMTIPNVLNTPLKFQVVTCTPRLKRTDAFSVGIPDIDRPRSMWILNVEIEEIILRTVKGTQEPMISAWNVRKSIFSILITKDARLKSRIVNRTIQPFVFSNVQIVLTLTTWIMKAPSASMPIMPLTDVRNMIKGLPVPFANRGSTWIQTPRLVFSIIRF